jgi:hypothetical protein
MVVHAGLDARQPVLLEGIGRQRHDGRARPAGQRAYCPRRLKTIHPRHLQIHQDKVVRGPPCQRYSLGAVLGQIHVQAGDPQQLTGHLLIDRLVLNQQDRAPAPILRNMSSHAPSADMAGESATSRHQNQNRLPAPGTLDADGASHQLRQALADGQPKPRAAILPRCRIVGLLEGQEQTFPVLRGNPDPGIAHLEAQHHAAPLSPGAEPAP